jgi:hypothetical protein
MVGSPVTVGRTKALPLAATDLAQRYFFTIRGWNRVEDDDPEGACLPNAAAALSYAEDKIRKLRKECGYNDLTLIMIVMDKAGQSVLSLPFFPGC